MNQKGMTSAQDRISDKNIKTPNKVYWNRANSSDIELISIHRKKPQTQTRSKTNQIDMCALSLPRRFTIDLKKKSISNRPGKLVDKPGKNRVQDYGRLKSYQYRKGTSTKNSPRGLKAPRTKRNTLVAFLKDPHKIVS